MKNELLEFALALAQAAENAIMPVFRNCAVGWKADGSEVTDGDRRAEEAMRQLIAKHMPGHQILGEEFGGPIEPTRGPLWVLDPIDGTASFALGLPTFGTLIGYLEDGEPQVGVIHCPGMGESVYASIGSGCWARVRGCDPQPVRVSTTAKLKDAYVSSFPETALPRPRKSRTIHDCVQHALVAQGRIDVAIDLAMHAWDIAAIVPCIHEAGGVVSDLDGHQEHIVWRKSLVSSSTKSLHEEVLSALSKRST